MTLFFMAACLPLPVWSEERSPIVRAQAHPATITIGDHLKCRLEVEHAAGDQIVFPDFTGQPGDWLLSNKRQLPQEKTAEPGWVRDSLELDVQIFKVGEQTLPPFDVELRSSAGKQATLHSEPLKVTVQSVLGEGKKELKEVKPQAELPPDYQGLIWLSAGLVGLAVAGALLFGWMKKRRKNKPETAAPPRPLDDLAREAIRILLAKELAAQGLFKEFYLELSEIIKRYLGGRLHVISLERTTEEFVADLAKTALSWQQTREVREFLEDCDLVKFAKYHPIEEEVSRIVQRALAIIDTVERSLNTFVGAGPEGKR